MKGMDQGTATKIHTILSLSRSRGADPVPILERAGLLRHKASMTRDHLQFLERAIEVVRTTTVDHDVHTPMDMRNAIITAMERARDDIATQH